MKNISVNKVNTRSIKEQKVKEKAMEEPTAPARETDLETPDQSIDRTEKKTTESIPMADAEEQEKKTIKFSPIANVDETTNNTPATIKDDSQTKRTSFTEKIAAMVGFKPKEKEELIPTTEKGKLIGTVSTLTAEAKQGEEQVTQGATANQDNQSMESKQTSLELGDLVAKLEQIDMKLECSEADRQELKKEVRHNKNENLEKYFVLARATEEKLQQMADKVETTHKEREKYIKVEMVEMKKRHNTVSEKLLNLEITNC